MKRTAAACVLTLGLVACGGNPFDESVDGGATAPGNVFATELNDDLTANALVYRDNGTADPSDDILIINNLPFDNTDSTGGGYTREGVLPNGFERYESPLTGTAGERQYFAVFRRSNVAQTAAIATNDYIDFGFGGAAAQQIGGASVPAARPATYTFTGDYAGIRVTRDSQNGSDGLVYVTGDAELFVDILDFDTRGAVEGIIDNRELYATDGTFLGTLDDFLSLATAEVDFTDATIGASTAVNADNFTSDVLGTGQWQGVFAGPNGQEIAGILVIEGAASSDSNDGRVRETGSLIVVNGG